MRALTLHQPWASLIANGVKTIETRSWSTNYRGPLAIHAGMKRPASGVDTHCASDVGDWHITRKGLDDFAMCTHTHYGHDIPLPLGAVVATCRLADVVPMAADIPQQSEWREPWSCLTLDPWPILNRWPGFGSVDGRAVSDQADYGYFAPGRYAWLLADITPCHPIPAKGHQGLWNWSAAAPTNDN